MKTKSALSYFGSDSEHAASLAALLGDCKHVTIPFVGGASIIPHLSARAIVANDKNDLAINFYRVISGRFSSECRDLLIDRCKSTLSHPAEILEAQSILRQKKSVSADVLAWAYWSACWIGRKGKGGTKHMGGMPSVRRTGIGGTNATRIKAAANDLRDWAKEFERCEWESVCFRELLPKVADRDGCGIYCDPPWVGAGRNYEYAFSETDHFDLATLLAEFKHAKVVIRYGNDPMIRTIYGRAFASRFDIVEQSARNQANSQTGEIWITNKTIPETLEANA